MNELRCYTAIDLKSFYASVECVSRGLDPLTTNLVVADASRSDKTICLAVTPSLKALGISGRPRLFEVKQKIKEINETTWPPVEYITAPPRMAKYIEVSSEVYETYLNFVASEDVHVYSIDEVFIDISGYLTLYNCTARELVMKMIQKVLSKTGITATAGIGPNMYLAKVAMDIVAKHIPPDKDGVRIAELDERTYRKTLWTHTPITDFWRIGEGTARRLEKYDIYTMGDIARCSVGKKNECYNEDILYKEFGINAELLIDHAWGFENCRISDIKAYRPKNHSLSNGQVLPHAYTYENTKIVVKEMAEELALRLVQKKLVTNQIFISLGYDISNLKNTGIRSDYDSLCNCKIETNFYGQQVPGTAGGRGVFNFWTSSTKLISSMSEKILERITQNKNFLVRRINICALNILSEDKANKLESEKITQPDLFGEFDKAKIYEEYLRHELQKEKSVQESVLEMKHKYGKNAIFKCMDLQSEATTILRNQQIGGHKA
ncbi:MAG: DNA methylase [Treponema sp.]|nr:DNA methylase [Treponema sp.]